MEKASDSSRSTLKSTLLRSFRRHFGRDPTLVVRAPGRINLIGEHTDYNLGYVLPAAINRWVMAGFSSRSDGRCTVLARDFGREDSFLIDNIGKHPQELWANYVRGVTRALLEEAGGSGFDAVIAGNVPIGCGLSSSAATEVALAVGLSSLWNMDLDTPTLARLCNRVEREFLGILSGIMDQFVSLAGKTGHALFLDCRDLSFRHISLPLDSCRLGVINPLIPRDLVRSPYNQRVQECRDAVKVIEKIHPSVRSPRDVTWDILEESREELGPVLFRRLRHVISENERTLEAVEHLINGSISRFGNLLYASHDSLRRDYEVSRDELDTLVSLCSDTDLCVGARMVGGGFGGCVMVLVKGDGWTPFVREISRAYRSRFRITPQTVPLRVSSGVHAEWI
ncbi:MAG: galactokinase [Fidelibacterota bacterium]